MCSVPVRADRTAAPDVDESTAPAPTSKVWRPVSAPLPSEIATAGGRLGPGGRGLAEPPPHSGSVEAGRMGSGVGAPSFDSDWAPRACLAVSTAAKETSVLIQGPLDPQGHSCAARRGAVSDINYVAGSGWTLKRLKQEKRRLAEVPAWAALPPGSLPVPSRFWAASGPSYSLWLCRAAACASGPGGHLRPGTDRRLRSAEPAVGATSSSEPAAGPAGEEPPQSRHRQQLRSRAPEDLQEKEGCT